MTQYLLSVHHDFDSQPDADEMATTFRDVDGFNQEVQAAGAWVFAGGLEAPETATVVRIGRGDRWSTDGPFAESKEHIGGFWVIEAADLDTALGWAEKGARACRATSKCDRSRTAAGLGR